MSRMSTLLTTEGSYPFHRGDVSTWCHALTNGLPDVDFTLLAVTTHPYLPLQYDLASNVSSVITVPVSGMEDPAEYGNHPSFPAHLRRRWATTTADVTDDYLPHLKHFLHQVTSRTEEPRALGVTLLQMHLHLRYYDYDRTQTHPGTWDLFSGVLQQAWRDASPAAAAPSAGELLAAWRLFYRLMLPLSVDIPRFDQAHASAPGFCGLPCVVGKLRWRTPYLLTEHSVYLREHYLGMASGVSSVFVRWFASRLTTAIVDVNYAFADQVSPVCERTAEWEQSRGVGVDRIRTIHNGVAPSSLLPFRRDEQQRPTVVSIGDFTSFKGQMELIEAAALVRRSVPGLQVRLYGSMEDAAYYHRCRELVAAMGLHDTVVFAGEPADNAAVLQQADVVAFASVSEGLPYALLDAMMGGVAIVATDAGGTREALEDAGMVVPPGDPAAMAEAIGTLLRLPDSGQRLGEHARERALQRFSETRCVEQYRASYEQLARPDAAPVSQPRVVRRREFARRAAVA